MVLSRSVFDLDHSNNPIIRIEVKSSTDVRDKIARRFIEALGSTSSWCEILPSGECEFVIYPLTPEQLREQAKYMLNRADDLEAATKKYASVVESA